MHVLEADILGSGRDHASASHGRTVIELSQSTTSGRARQRAISHGLVLIAHAAGMRDVRLETGYIGYALDDGATGVA